MKKYFLYFLICVFIFSGCKSTEAFYSDKEGEWADNALPESELEYALFLLGDGGHNKHDQSTLNLLSTHLSQVDRNSAVTFLGNNAFPFGLPDVSDIEKCAVSIGQIQRQQSVLTKFEGNAYFIGGNRDWSNGGRKGLKHILNQQEYIESLVNEKMSFFPGDGCPGPKEVQVNDHLTFLFIDTQWWLHEWEKPMEDRGCGIVNENDFFIHINDAIKRNEGKKIVVMGHHPIYSNGPHGGKVSQSWHFLPVLGTIYTGYRKLVGSNQDLASLRYQQLKKGLKSIFKNHPNLIYASAHDHSLQYFDTDAVHQVVSGAGSKTSYIKKGGRADFAHSSHGFAKLAFFKSGQVWLEFWEPDVNKAEGKVAFRKLLLKHTPSNKEELNVKFQHLNFADSIRAFTGSEEYKGGGFLKKKFFGNNYRVEWGSEIKGIPYFDMAKEHGGLRIVQRGGGMQTKSLRFEDKKGKQYVLRSIAKYPESAIPDAFKGTFIADLVKDQISASHPYAAFVVPELATAAGVYHTNPKIVWLPDDPRLGNYRRDFANGIFLYEERIAGNREDVASFGNSEDIVSTIKVIKEIEKNHKSYIDQKQVVLSRLFDVLIGDWDRHDDQWRWASFKDEKGRTYYQPIPRDRDQAFFNSDGILLSIGSRKWANPKFQGFREEIRDVEGLVFNARYFDRTFLTELERQEWLDAAKIIQSKLTDDVIEKAIAGFPTEIYEKSGAQIITKLKKRRDDLTAYAEELFEFFSETVSVVGTKKKEFFQVTVSENGGITVTMFTYSENSKGRNLYERTFFPHETKEIRLYGLEGKDHFEIQESANKKIKIRIIGGEGKDRVEHIVSTKGASKRILVYDTPDGITMNKSAAIKDKTSNQLDINTYDRKEFKYDVVAPLFFLGFNPDDGFFLGGGATITNHGFRKSPYAYRQTIKANIAPRTSSYNFDYELSVTDVFKDWNFDLLANVQAPSFTRFFYGLGNESLNNQEINEQGFYRVRLSSYLLNPVLTHKINAANDIYFGTYFRSAKVIGDDVEEERFINGFSEARTVEFSDPDLQVIGVRRNSIGFNIGYNLDTRDNKINPSKGIHFKTKAEGVKDVSHNEFNFVNLNAESSVYYSFGHTFKTTLALRAGAATNIGDFEFYQAQTLGGFQNLRGFRKMRFSGKSTFFQNSELRIKLFDFKTAAFPSVFGVKLIHDFGKVWIDAENSDVLHRGYGGGVWFTPFNKLVINAEYTYSNSSEDPVLFIHFGHLF